MLPNTCMMTHRALSCRLGPLRVGHTSGCVHIFEERILYEIRQMARKQPQSTAKQAHNRQDNATSFLHDDSPCSAVSSGFRGRPHTRRCAHTFTFFCLNWQEMCVCVARDVCMCVDLPITHY